MRDRAMGGVALFAVLAVVATPVAQGVEPAAELDRYVTRVVEDWEVPGLAIAVVKDGEIAFAKGYGVKELGEDGAIDEHTLFSIGSTTKAMTAATVGLMVDQGKIDWDDPVRRHIPRFRLKDPYASREVTVRDLLTHRAGLGNADLLWYGTGRSRESLIDKLALVEPVYSMRDGFLYQNIMYIAAGVVAAKAAGTTWEELMSEGLFAPLGMERTVSTFADSRKRDNVASPHDEVDGVLTVIENVSADAAGPAGTVWSSVSEMGRWIRMLMAGGKWEGKQVLSEAVVAELLDPQTILDLRRQYPAFRLVEHHWATYGLGWFQADYEGRAVSFHTGSIDGMSAIVGMIPDESLGVVILQNRDHSECRHALMWKVFDLWGGKVDGRDWSADLKDLYDEVAAQGEARQKELEQNRVAGTSPSLPLERYAGAYHHPLYDEIQVTSDSQGLRLVFGPGLAASLAHWHYDTFEARFDRRWRGEGLVTFSLDGAGDLAAVEMFGIRYERVPDEE